MKKFKFFLSIISIIFASIFIANTSFALGPTNVPSKIVNPTTWTKENSPYLVEGNVYINSPLTIEPGVVIKFYYQSRSLFYVNSDLIAKGTEDEPITFTSIRDDSYGGDTNNDGLATVPKPGDWTNIEFGKNSHSELDHVNVLYASVPNIVLGALTIASDNVIVRNSTIRFSGYVGLYIINCQPTIEGNTISNNNVGVYVSSNELPTIKNNSIFNNKAGAIAKGDFYQTPKLDARNNWWGDESGPYFKHYNYGVDNLSGKGNHVGDGVVFDSWTNKNPSFFRKPIIFVPGIGASINPDLMISGIFADNWKMFDRTYDGIIESFKAMGYVEGKNLFIAYYDWRKSNIESAQDFLKPVIQKALLMNAVSKVNIVTHSMGSLVARSYVQSDEFANDVDNLIMIAPPNKGSSNVYSAWAGGRIPNNWENKLIMKVYLEYLTAVTIGTSNYFDTIHKFIPSLKDLMPVYNFIHLAGDEQNLKDYLSMNEKNEFLTNLNLGIDKLNQRTRFSIILGDKQPTVNKIPTINSDVVGVWVDGKPDPINPQSDDSGGDGEVLISSADIKSQFRDVLNFGHREIVSQSEQIVAERLNDDLDKTYESPIIKDEIYFWSDAPAEMTIIDPDEKTVSENGSEIENSSYSEESKKDGFKIASVSNPKKGIYKVKLDGNKDGTAHIGMVYGDNTGNNEEVVVTIPVSVTSNAVAEYVVKIDPENTEVPVTELALFVPPVIIPEIEIPPVIEENPIIPPLIVPAVLPITLPVANATPVVLGFASANPVVQSTQSSSVKKSSKKKSKSKKKKAKKAKVSKLSVQMKKVLGLSKNKNVKQKGIITKTNNVVVKKTTNTWNKAENTWKNLIAKTSKYFKR